jgi:phosphomannomutase
MSDDRLMVSVSGVRGTVGGTLTLDVARDFGSAFATMLGAGKTVTIGTDTRPSGAEIRAAVIEGLLAGGVNVVDLGVATTPGCALMTVQLGTDGGVIITASHNPSQYNGIKFLQPTGPGLLATRARELKAIWEAGNFAVADAPGQCCEEHSTDERHIRAVCDVVDVDAVAAKKFKVVVDSINGAGCRVTPKLMAALGCELVHLNATGDGNFAHAPEPIAENLTSLCDAVREHDADVGFAQDPDADRLVVVDEAGTFIGEEYTLALATDYVLASRPGPVGTNLATSRMVDDLAARAGVKVFRSPTGEANVVETMLANGCVIGGEGNGGVIDPRVVLVRNSLIGMALILEAMAKTGQTVSQRVSQIPSYVMLKTKMPCPAGVASEISIRVCELFESHVGASFNTDDGLRVDLENAWVSVRESNTEPILRVMAEAPDEATAQSLIDQVSAIARDVVGK